MDDGRYGKSGGDYSLQDCADAVQRLHGNEGCKGQYFFYEDSKHCNCPKDDCEEGPNGNAGGAGQLYKFTCEIDEMLRCNDVADIQYKEVNNKGCSSYINMDDPRYGKP